MLWGFFCGGLGEFMLGGVWGHDRHLQGRKEKNKGEAVKKCHTGTGAFHLGWSLEHAQILKGGIKENMEETVKKGPLKCGFVGVGMIWSISVGRGVLGAFHCS